MFSIECEAEETYCLLAQGFHLLVGEASVREAERMMDPNQSRGAMGGWIRQSKNNSSNSKKNGGT